MSLSTKTESPVEVTEDSLLGGRVRFLQPAAGYRAAVDPVLLAAMAPAEAGMQVLDLGCGAGAVLLCLLARVPDLTIIGIEAEPEMCDLARRNAELNGVTDRFEVRQGRIEARPPLYEEGAFDLVLANPPYQAPETADPSANRLKAAAHVEADTVAADWIEAAYRALRHKGRFAMVQRADRLADLLAPLDRRFGGIEVHPLYPKPGRPAKRVVLIARKGVRTPLALSSGIVLHNMDGSYSPAVAAALDTGYALAPALSE
ncbi:tRNA1(Val) (adenine(37)-N6)-methyltransferase [Nisaea sediminum]|uniref:tRNA1(Val) (adenine(37)-N6)-methyltransferase n=1 Tax=Nisaea sediminum TaxID=2775867 RepID=UPI0029BFDB7E|nr:methyltransferase domain-containing protein [Nisaea sediminum]